MSAGATVASSSSFPRFFFRRFCFFFDVFGFFFPFRLDALAVLSPSLQGVVRINLEMDKKKVASENNVDFSPQLWYNTSIIGHVLSLQQGD